ncbi:MAG: energy-coupling factor ABC transporter ATP-binding protein [Gammaproteobacteria bacterium]|nr:MAG: energy-coupling factor ABC transporter ATP-binding protein [Gammaproteobacteria bacterium]
MKPFNLVFSRIHKHLGRKTILRNEHFSVRSGEFNLLCGNNGAGKTTLLRIIAGLEKPDMGQIDMGSGTTTWRKSRKHLQHLSVYLHQHPYMFDCNVKKNLAYALPQRHLSLKEKNHLIDTALDLAHISDLAECSAKNLSGGEQQRVALARAWLRQPSIMLLDEPTANMDKASCARTISLLKKLKSQGLALFVASHDPDQFLNLADNKLHLVDGKLTSNQLPCVKSPKIFSIRAA